MRIMSIASGSSGNCIYVGNDNTHLLIDAGISRKRIEEGLNSIGLTLSDMTGVLVTHEHADHISGLGVVLRKNDIPVYGTNETMEALTASKYLEKVDYSLLNGVFPDSDYEIGGLKVHPFSISHDAVNPCGYRITDSYNGKSVAIATDMGHFNDYIVDKLQNLDAVLLEANHDVKMLQVGTYPYYLKQRILSNHGHLCNEVAGRLLDNILSDKMKKVYLGHLSKENNYPDLAFESVRAEINLSDSPFKADDFDIEVAKRECVTEYFDV